MNENNQKILTVVVLDDNSQPTEGARVSIKPSDASGVTSSTGEIEFKLGSSTKYEVTASFGNKTVTVPYYVTQDGATRLVVNPTYVRKIEKQLGQHTFLSSNVVIYTGIAIGIIILFIVILKFFKRKKNKK